MKKRPKLNKKTLRNLKLKLKQVSDKKVAPLSGGIIYPDNPSNGASCI